MNNKDNIAFKINRNIYKLKQNISTKDLASIDLVEKFSNPIFIKETIKEIINKNDFSFKFTLFILKSNIKIDKESITLSLIDIYNYLLLKINPSSRIINLNFLEVLFIEILLIYQEEISNLHNVINPNLFISKHKFQFLTQKEKETLLNDEYSNFLKGFYKDRVYLTMILSKELFSYTTLEHVLGVHSLGMNIARQLHSMKVPIDLGRVSGALAGHDIGKYGVKHKELKRVPYLHYYYTDIWFKKHKINHIRNIAVNHSTWDLELENLSIESLILIYSDFRVKEKIIDNKNVMSIIDLEESFNIVLNKLDNLDDVKKERYRKVYNKLKDFENFLKNLGVNVNLSSKPNKKLNKQPFSNPSLLFDENIIKALKFHSINHSVSVMNIFKNAESLSLIIEKAKETTSHHDLLEYLLVFDEYNTYFTKTQKNILFAFLLENLLYSKDQIRYHSANLIGKIIGKYDEDYRKEMPLSNPGLNKDYSGLNLLGSTLDFIFYPIGNLSAKEIFNLQYSLKSIVENMIFTLPKERLEIYSSYILNYLSSINLNRINEDLSLFILESVLFLNNDLNLTKELLINLFNLNKNSKLLFLHIISGKKFKSNLDKEIKDIIIKDLYSFKISSDLTENYTYLKAANKFNLINMTKSLEESLRNSNKTDVENIYLDNLKLNTHWLIKEINIELLHVLSTKYNLIPPTSSALHFNNLLRVSPFMRVRNSSGKHLISILNDLNLFERNDISIELLKSLDAEGEAYTDYIPRPLGLSLLYLNENEFNEIINEFIDKSKTSTIEIRNLIIKTISYTIAEFTKVGLINYKLDSKKKNYYTEKMLGIIMIGLSDETNMLSSRTSLISLGNKLFNPESKNTKEQYQIFRIINKKLLVLLERNPNELLFLSQSIALKNIYRFISDYIHKFGDFKFKDNRKIAFFPGTFDPFSKSHLLIAKTIRDMGFIVYIAIDEFSWSKKTLPNKIKRNIVNMSIGKEFYIYTFPENIPINIANQSSLKTLISHLGKDVHIVCGSDVILNASSYKKEESLKILKDINHIVFDRNIKIEDKDNINNTLKNVSFLKLPNSFKDISSSVIRENIDDNISIFSLVDPLVNKYISKNNYYKSVPELKEVINISAMETIIYKSYNDEIKGYLKELYSDKFYAIENSIKKALAKPFGEIMLLLDINKNKAIGFAAFYNLKNNILFETFNSFKISEHIRSISLGNTALINSIFIQNIEKNNDALDILITEILSYLLSQDYEGAIYYPHDEIFSSQNLRYALDLFNFKIHSINDDILYVNMKSPIIINLNMLDNIKYPYNESPKVLSAIKTSRIKLRENLKTQYPKDLILPFNNDIIKKGIIKQICLENKVPITQSKPRVLGKNMCVPYGDILDKYLIPNTVTKSLHTEKYFNLNIDKFIVKEFSLYLSLENQIKTISEFNRLVILVDTLIHKGKRIEELSSYINSKRLHVKKIITGIISSRGKDIMKQYNYDVSSVYYIPNLKIWLDENDLYPFLGGDSILTNKESPADILYSVNISLPYSSPKFLIDSGAKDIYSYSKRLLTNSLNIIDSIEKEYNLINQKNLNLYKLNEIFNKPRVPYKGEYINYILSNPPSYYIKEDLTMLYRFKAAFKGD